MTSNYFRVGGLAADLPAGMEQEIREFVDEPCPAISIPTRDC